LLRGVALWTIWISRNDASFNHNRWNREKTEQVVWQNFSDYGRCAWNKTRQRALGNPASSESQLAKFDAQWLRPAICTRNGLSVTWIRVRPAGIGDLASLVGAPVVSLVFVSVLFSPPP
jgi:hypothetical protein